MLRLPEGMREQLKSAAEQHGRTMNAEIVARLRATFDETISTTVEVKAKALDEGRVELDLDAIAAKVAEKLAKPQPKYVIVGNLGRPGGEAHYSLMLPGYKTRSNEPYGPPKRRNSKKPKP